MIVWMDVPAKLKGKWYFFLPESNFKIDKRTQDIDTYPKELKYLLKILEKVFEHGLWL